MANNEEIIKCGFQRWYVITFLVSLTMLLLLCALYIFRIFTYYGLIFSHILQLSFLVFFAACGGYYLLRILYYTITATEDGLTTGNIIGLNNSCKWEEIEGALNPLFCIPKDKKYLKLKNKKKLLIVMSMPNTKELLELIKLRVPNFKERRRIF